MTSWRENALKIARSQRERHANAIARSGPEYWTRFSFPFWFTDLLSALDSLSRMDWPPLDPMVEHALFWLAERQRPSGLFNLWMVRAEDKRLPEWLALAIHSVVKRFRL